MERRASTREEGVSGNRRVQVQGDQAPPRRGSGWDDGAPMGGEGLSLARTSQARMVASAPRPRSGIDRVSQGGRGGFGGRIGGDDGLGGRGGTRGPRGGGKVAPFRVVVDGRGAPPVVGEGGRGGGVLEGTGARREVVGVGLGAGVAGYGGGVGAVAGGGAYVGARGGVGAGSGGRGGALLRGGYGLGSRRGGQDAYKAGGVTGGGRHGGRVVVGGERGGMRVVVGGERVGTSGVGDGSVRGGWRFHNGGSRGGGGFRGGRSGKEYSNGGRTVRGDGSRMVIDRELDEYGEEDDTVFPEEVYEEEVETEAGFVDDFQDEDDLLGDEVTEFVPTRLPVWRRLAIDAMGLEAVVEEAGIVGRVAQKRRNLSYAEAVTGSVGSVDKGRDVDDGEEIEGEGGPWQEVSYRRKRSPRPLLPEHLRGRSDVRLVGDQIVWKCHDCGIWGHVSRDCKVGLRCYECKGPGHIAPNCPNRDRVSVGREVRRPEVQTKEIGGPVVGVERAGGMVVRNRPTKVIIDLSSPMEELDSYFESGIIASAKIGNPTEGDLFKEILRIWPEDNIEDWVVKRSASRDFFVRHDQADRVSDLLTKSPMEGPVRSSFAEMVFGLWGDAKRRGEGPVGARYAVTLEFVGTRGSPEGGTGFWLGDRY